MVFFALSVSKSLAQSASAAVMTADEAPPGMMAFHIEPGAEDVLSDIPGGPGLLDRLLQPRHRALAELAAAVDVSEVALDRVAADDQAFEEHVRAAQQDLTVLEGPRFAFVGVHHQILGKTRLLAHEVPLHAGGEAGAAAAAQVRLDHLVHDLLRLHLQRFGQRLVAATGAVGIERPALRLVPVGGEDRRPRHRFRSALPASARVVTAGCPSVPVACGALWLSMRAW